MRIWLDDVRPAPHGFIHVRNLAELKELLAANPEPIKVMSFDHDLGDGTPDGYAIVKWLAEAHLNRWPRKIIVHSSNPPGAENIRQYDAFIRRHVLTQAR